LTSGPARQGIRSHCGRSRITSSSAPQKLGNYKIADTRALSVSLGLPQEAAIIGIATAMQESTLENIAYGTSDSLGLFQQRPSQGWGTPAEIMDPTYAATKFYEALAKVPDWQTIPLTQAAQAVQESGYPDAYAQWQTDAEYLVSTVSGALDNCPATQH
jgi:hypothetical protein